MPTYTYKCKKCEHTVDIFHGISAKPRVKCPKCGEGEMVERRSRRGIFYSCSRYPKCDQSFSNKPIAKECPQCHAPVLVEKESKREGLLEACANKECGYKAPPVWMTPARPPSRSAAQC
jgi:DNA topoisomerase-1